ARTRPTAPMTPLNRSISPNRRYATARAELACFKTVAKAAGGTVNDSLLAVVTGMLAHYLAAAEPGAALKRAPVALVPVSVRDGDGGLGNRISTVFVDLPIDEPDLGRRIAAINAQTHAIKESAAVRAGALMVGASGAAPPLVSGLLGRAMGSVRAFNVVVSNMPGPQQPFYLSGVRLADIFPIVPLNPANQGLSLGIVSYDGEVCFGLLADRNLAPGLPVATAGLEAALAELSGRDAGGR
ncbi:MAG: DUF1298 domain-containing protein, partial [Solirubrobacterales bacterium]|nr:DUF1298 domain-containing protein [Solirubrobacterales bacterium]